MTTLMMRITARVSNAALARSTLSKQLQLSSAGAVVCSRSLHATSASTSAFSQPLLHGNAKTAGTSVTRFEVTSRLHTNYVRQFSSEGKEIEVKVPHLADSITSADVQSFVKAVGDIVEPDEVVASLETDKVSIEVRAPERGKITQFCVELNAKVKPGDPLFKLVTVAAGASAAKAQPKAEAPKAAAAPSPQPSAAKDSQQTPAAATQQAAPQPAPSAKPTPSTAPTTAAPSASSRTERRVPMNRMRQRIAERLKDSQNTYALLTTFQEVDMHNLMNLREAFQEEFTKKHGVKLGFMSAFVKASTAALQEQPIVNAVIDGTDIVYRDYVDISVAVATPKGLVVPVLRNCQNMSFADVEKELAALGQKAKADKIAIEDMTGGSFTISNGGVYGSLMGTPIINPPQSAILGMHGIVKRPVVLSSKGAEDQIAIRPIMYLALTYDHRLIDGREAVTFLRSIKATIEDPRRLLLQL